MTRERVARGKKQRTRDGTRTATRRFRKRKLDKRRPEKAAPIPRSFARTCHFRYYFRPIIDRSRASGGTREIGIHSRADLPLMRCSSTENRYFSLDVSSLSRARCQDEPGESRRNLTRTRVGHRRQLSKGPLNAYERLINASIFGSKRPSGRDIPTIFADKQERRREKEVESVFLRHFIAARVTCRKFPRVFRSTAIVRHATKE